MKARYPFAVIKEKLHARGGELLDFAIGARKVPLADELRDWVYANPGLALQPASPDEVAALKQAAVDFLQTEYDATVSSQQIVPVPGGRVGMSAFIACVVAPGTGVVTTEPGYPAFARMAHHRHANVLNVYLDPEHAFAPDISTISDAINVGVIALNYPNNPTAAVFSQDTRSAAADLARKHAAVVFNDAVYGPLTYDGHPSCLLTDHAAGNSGVQFVELHSLTKLYPLGPLSGSFLVGTDEQMQAIATYSEFAWSPMSTLQTRATTWCLGDASGRHRIRDFYAQQLGGLRDILVDLGFQPYPTPSGMYALCRLPTHIAGRAVGSAQEAAAVLLDDFAVAVMPYDVPGNNYLRFCSLYSDQDLETLAGLKDRLRLGGGD